MLIACNIYSQSDLDIFGFAQIRAKHRSFERSGYFMAPPPPGFQDPQKVVISQSLEEKNVTLQILSLFFRKEFKNDYTFFLNTEFTNSYSSGEKWGNFSIAELWIRKEYSSSFNYKIGLLVPRFNQMNEVKNRMPFIPYIERPLVYESSLAFFINFEDYIPERAFLQFDGSFFKDNLIFDYALYIGDSEFSSFGQSEDGLTPSGNDLTTNLLFGGRFGIEYKELKLGVSGTYDKDNRNITEPLYDYGLDTPLGKYVPRYRLGIDFMYRYGKFSLIGEYIDIQHDDNTPNLKIDKSFYFYTLQYDLNQKWFGYYNFSHIEGQHFSQGGGGNDMYKIGGGYRILDNMILKFAYSFIKNADPISPVHIPDGPPLKPGDPLPTKWQTVTGEENSKTKQIHFAISVMF